jgi:hypothetical protein
VIAVPSQLCECHKEFAYTAPNPEAITTFAFLFCKFWGRMWLVFGGHGGLCYNSLNGNVFSSIEKHEETGKKLMIKNILQGTQQNVESCKCGFLSNFISVTHKL